MEDNKFVTPDDAVPEEATVTQCDCPDELPPEDESVCTLIPGSPEPDLSSTTRMTDEYLSWLAALDK